MKFADKKSSVENKITNIVKQFINETGVDINYIDVHDEKSTGFNLEKSPIKTTIILKND